MCGRWSEQIDTLEIALYNTISNVNKLHNICNKFTQIMLIKDVNGLQDRIEETQKRRR